MRWVDKTKHNLLNIPGWHSKRHIVVFESDDWGSIRMPSIEVLHKLQAHGGIAFDRYGYDYADTLASNDDLEMLMEVLDSVKDGKGNPAIITLNCCVANPDFEKIEGSGFQAYYYEPFPDTLKRYPHHDRAFDLWKEGIAHRVFQPQFHGREHLNALMWMQLLQSNIENVRTAFKFGVFSLNVHQPNDPRQCVLDAFNVLHKEDYDFACQSVRDGLNLFEQLFGFRSETMIAPCYTWDREIEIEAVKGGVKAFQGGHVQKASAYAKSQGIKSTRHFTGQRNNYGQLYMIRTCNFEPTQGKMFNAENCLEEIGMDFQFRKPAIVSCHRLNFIGELDPANRDNNLKDFQWLLKKIVEKWPDVEFMSSDELAREINGLEKWTRTLKEEL